MKYLLNPWKDKKQVNRWTFFVEQLLGVFLASLIVHLFCGLFLNEGNLMRINYQQSKLFNYTCSMVDIAFGRGNHK